ncbi:hypothetical protein [Candidatus Avelusimicrobium fimicolum]|uniref:hypothetical protein n=1 Tax=Candidatus Avelusimicrobium fimicolum TaxID=3416216 RepID=UPI003D10BA8A
MITYKTHHLVEKFLSDIEYQAQTDNVRVQQTKTGLCTGLRGVDWQIGGLRAGDLFLLIGSQEQVNTAFLAFILHALCWRQQVPAHVYSCAKPVDQWLPYLLSAELKISYSSLQWGVIGGDTERIKRAGQFLGKLPLWLSELSLASARWSDFEASKGQILLIDDFPLETEEKSEAFWHNLKRIARQKGKIILINAMLDEKLCRYPDIYANLRPFGLLGSVCDFVGLLNWCIPGANSLVDATGDTGNTKIIEQDFSPLEQVELRMLYNVRLPRSYAIFLHQFNVVDFRDKIV